MGDKKRKGRGDHKKNKERVSKKSKGIVASKKNERGERRRRGPGLPNSLRKEIDILNRVSEARENEDEEYDSGDAAGDDFYEYEETVAEEEKKKNRRFDPVENYEYQIPDEIEVWDFFYLFLNCFSVTDTMNVYELGFELIDLGGGMVNFN